MLPKRDGYQVCRDIRQHGLDLPILMLTAKTLVVDRVVGLQLGADDYLAKPFDPAELLARIEALLRRSAKGKRNSCPHVSVWRRSGQFRERRSKQAGDKHQSRGQGASVTPVPDRPAGKRGVQGGVAAERLGIPERRVVENDRRTHRLVAAEAGRLPAES
jgi:response regulator RpfG family c-di-GMP phosphodiesterase